MTRVVRMNESTSDGTLENIPLPAQQQLGYFNKTVDTDARSGNGVDQLREDTDGRREYGVLPPADGGSKVLPVTYHLENTAPPAEPAGAPGSESYNNARSADGVQLETRANATTATQSDQYASTQREIPGRNERMGAALGYDDHASAEAGSGDYAKVLLSNAAETTNSDNPDEVPTGTSAQVLSWVGSDAERAQQAKDAEERRPNPRTTLITKLDDIIEDSK